MALTLAEIKMIAEEVAKLLPVQDDVLTVKSAAIMLDTTPKALRYKANKGQVPAHKRGHTWYFSRRELVNFLLTE